MSSYKILFYKTLFFITLLFISSAISLNLPGYDWETDYGHHYYISMFNDGSLKLYENFHIHKGPVSIFLMDIIGFIIGYGWKQSIITYAVLVFLFLSISSVIVVKNFRNILYSLLTIIFILTFFRNQGSNIFHELIVNIFLLSSIHFFLNYLIHKNKKDILFFSFFFSVAILTRIDTIIYSFPFLSTLLIVFYKEKILKKLNLNFFIQNILIFIFVFFSFALVYNFSINEFLLNNVYFNLEYSKDYNSFKTLSYLYHLLPNKIILFVIFIKSVFYISETFSKRKIFRYLLFLISIIQFFLFLFKIDHTFHFFHTFLFLSVLIIELIVVTYFFLKDKKNNNIKLILTLYLLFTSSFIYLKAGSFKLNHVFILFVGFFYFYCFFIKHLFTSNLRFKNLLIFLLFILSLDQTYKIFNSIKNPIIRNENISLDNGINNLFYNKDLIENNILIETINEFNTPILCDRSWPHIFNKKQSIDFMFDWWMYDDKKKYINKTIFEKLYNNILLKTHSHYFIIDKSCDKDKDNIYSKSKYLINLNNKSVDIKEIRFFNYKYLLKKIN